MCVCHHVTFVNHQPFFIGFLFCLLIISFGKECPDLVQQHTISKVLVFVFQPLLISSYKTCNFNCVLRSQLCRGSFTMKDRLEELKQKAQDFSEAASENTFMGGDDDDFVVLGIITPEAVLFEEEPIIGDILSDSQQIRNDITLLETEVQINL